MKLKDKKVVVIGGSSGMGLEIAKSAAQAEADTIIASRSPQKLEAALAEIEHHVSAYPIDLTDSSSIKEFFQRIGAIDYLIISGSSLEMGAFRELPVEKAMQSMDSKFWGPYRAVKAAQMSDNGSIILFSGGLSRKPSKGAAIVSAINAAIEGLGRALALELAPVRVNVISPGVVQTPIYSDMPEDKREQMYNQTAEKLPVNKVGKTEDIAKITLEVMSNDYITGTVIDVNGGSFLV
ncbi:MAG: SDR family oxidoreductase [Rivularia sp. (in: Bacteria)]|nr:SDR family oxidoreductase [Rivularia sp. MS3]